MNNKQRREFLKRLTYTFAAGTTASVMPKMNFLGQAMASQNRQFDDYKAIVCLELDGGCDSFSMLTPRDSVASGSRYDTYLNSRGGAYTNGIGIGYDFDELLPVSSTADGSGPVMSSGSFGLNPEFADRAFSNNGAGTTPGLQSLYNQGNVAFLANVGSLIEPITKFEYLNGIKRAPRAPGSHSDQRIIWDTGGILERNLGWGGSLIGEILDGGADNAIFPASISLYGNSLFNIGKIAGTNTPIPSYILNAGGAIPLRYFGGNNPKTNALNDLYASDYFSAFSQEYKKTFARARNFANDFNTLLEQGAGSTAQGDGWGRINVPYQTSGNFDPVNNRYPSAQVTVNGQNYENRVFSQLQTVARLIKISRTPAAGVNASRQVYFVKLPDFDTHSTQMDNDSLFRLMASISQAVGYFSQAMQEIGAENEVTLFTSSEFGRTLTPNGTGTDHAWGGVHFAMGGAVNGGKIYGRYPNLELNADNDAESDWSFDRGQYIPTTSVEQMMATIAAWMGADGTQLDAIFPNLSNFNNSDLGFMS
ncbi:DUF1501 domain-containing protein [Marinicella sp. W31]|uniref:DUF1501 domain-containing protein n=1 Tax=Marinicella sp. W31 TaxID=3023713 RepID=UPI003756B07D